MDKIIFLTVIISLFFMVACKKDGSPYQENED